ncbi:MAG: 4-hydroxy-tetrahydrodipicolinate synthase [Bradymonadales bacterium]|jgi:4-hydroxy-tetrahydrodipicolinate synthase
MKNWKGAWAAIPTPMRDGELDLEALERFLSFLLDGHVDGVVVCGTTGEAATLRRDERLQLYARCREVIAGRVPLLAGVGTNDTASTIDNAKDAAQAGMDGLLVVTPYYNKPNQEGLFRHFMALAEAVDLPQILYNVPSRTGTNLLPATIARLSLESERFAGIKDATGDMLVASETRKTVRPDFLMFSGDDATTLPFICLGGCGAISVVANVAPRLMHDICDLALNADLQRARALHHEMLPLFRALFSDTSPIPLKAVLSAKKLGIANELRAPLYAMQGESLKNLIERCKAWI